MISRCAPGFYTIWGSSFAPGVFICCSYDWYTSGFI